MLFYTCVMPKVSFPYTWVTTYNAICVPGIGIILQQGVEHTIFVYRALEAQPERFVNLECVSLSSLYILGKIAKCTARVLFCETKVVFYFNKTFFKWYYRSPSDLSILHTFASFFAYRSTKILFFNECCVCGTMLNEEIIFQCTKNNLLLIVLYSCQIIFIHTYFKYFITH